MPAKTEPLSDLLAAARFACTPPDLVRVTRSRLGNAAVLDGFVVDVSPNLLLLHLLSDRIDLNGYAAVRVPDLASLDRDFSRKAFYLEGLRLKGVKPARPAGIDLADVPSLTRSVQERFPLLVIHRETVTVDECEIGRIKLTSENTYALRWISPEGTWEDDGRSYRYSDITRVGFDGEYENTLALVATERGKTSDA